MASYAIAFAAFVAALALLYRLVELELGRRMARPTLLLLAVFPAAVFFGAPYSESLFLLCAVGAFYAARTRRFAWAGVAAMGAATTRSAGLLLLVPLAMLWWTSAPRRPRDLAWLALAPLGVAAYAAWLGLAEGDALRFLDVQDAWSRELGGAAHRRLGRLHGGRRRGPAARLGIAQSGLLRDRRRRPVSHRGDQHPAVRRR